jgi:Flp pilus assembly protein TadG
MRRLFDTLRRSSANLRRDRRGAVAVTFGLLAVPLVVFAGLAVDYAQLVRVRVKLNGAADSAVLATVATQSPTYAAATSMPGDGPIPQGAADAVELFNAETANRVRFTVNNVSAVVNKSNGSVSATLQYTAQVPTAFMRVAGISTMTLSGTASASNGLVTYIDFYLLLDNSPSMGLGATPTDISNLEYWTQQLPPLHKQCAFACQRSIGSRGLLYRGAPTRHHHAHRCAAHGDPAADGHRRFYRARAEPIPRSHLHLQSDSCDDYRLDR